MKLELKQIGEMKTDFPTKFGLPRQGCFGASLTGQLIFEPEYRRREALRGIEEYTRLWILWGFSEAERETWSPTVTPPRLGGKVHKGVFATRAPYRPNPIGLTCVRLERVEWETPRGPVLWLSGIDMMDGSPVYDVKPYIPYADAWPDASSSFGGREKEKVLEVEFPEDLLRILPKDKQAGALEMLRQDPRPPYHNHTEQIYKIAYAGYDIHFTVDDAKKKLSACRVIRLSAADLQRIRAAGSAVRGEQAETQRYRAGSRDELQNQQ